MPFGYVESNPVRVRVQTSRLADRYYAGPYGVNRARRRVRSSVASRTRSQCIAKAFWIQPKKPANWLHLARLRSPKSPFGISRMVGLVARSEDSAIEHSDAGEILTISTQAPKVLRVCGCGPKLHAC